MTLSDFSGASRRRDRNVPALSRRETMASDLTEISNTLWSAADKLRPNSGIRPAEYTRPVLGLLFLRHADERFAAIEKKLSPRAGSRVKPGPDAYKAEGAIFLPPESRFVFLLTLPEGANLGRALTTAMREIEDKNPELEDVLPKTYKAIPDDVLVEFAARLATAQNRGRRVRPCLRIFHGQFRQGDDAEGWRVLYAGLDRSSHCRSAGALSRPHPRSRLRFGRHVRAFRRIREAASEGAREGAFDLWRERTRETWRLSRR
jgi:hypothetical protein